VITRIWRKVLGNETGKPKKNLEERRRTLANSWEGKKGPHLDRQPRLGVVLEIKEIKTKRGGTRGKLRA